MKELYPSYYPRFRCAGGRCGHNCCIGWEIDIDPKRAALYRALPGALGERLRRGMEGEPPHFRLDREGRCPLLAADGLCDLQRALGEGALCSICRDHPRYRVFLPGRTEIGLGLCCPEAGRLLLSQTEPVTLRGRITAAPPRETREQLLFRHRLLSAAQDRRFPLAGRMKRILLLSGAALPARSRRDWADILAGLEPLEPDWPEILTAFGRGRIDREGARAALGRWETEYEQLLVYFLLRHLLSDGGRDRAPRAAFAVFSTGMLHAMGAEMWTRQGCLSREDRVELARRWSANLEYSRENMEKLLAALAG